MGKIAWCCCALLLVALAFVPGKVDAQMYVCVDSRGKEQYTNMNFSASCRPLGKKVGITTRPRSWGGGTKRGYGTVSRPASDNASKYDHHIRQSSRRHNVDPFLIKAVIKAESDFDQYALSKKGAQGLMQLMPGTAKDLNVRNPFNAHENIDGGTRYLKSMLELFDGNIVLSLAAYNAGPNLIKRLQRIPKNGETRRYVKKVLANYKGYRGYLPKY